MVWPKSILYWAKRKDERLGGEEDCSPGMRLNPHCVPQLSAACPHQSKAWVKLDWTLLRKPRDASLSKHCANRQWPEGKVGRARSPHSYCHGDSLVPEILRPHVEIVLISFAAISARDASDKSHTATFSSALQRNKKGGKSCFPYITTNSSFG